MKKGQVLPMREAAGLPVQPIWKGEMEAYCSHRARNCSKARVSRRDT